MKITLKKGSYDKAPKDFVRIAFTDKPKGTKRLVREKGVETLEVGVGKGSEMNLRRFIILCRAVVNAAKANGFKEIAVQFDRYAKLFGNLRGVTPEHITELAAENFEMANYEFNTFQTKPKEGWNTVEEIRCYTPVPALEKAAKKGQMIGQAVNACRALSNTPSSDMTPVQLGKAAQLAGRGLKLSVRVLRKKEIQRLGMGGVLGVAKGSAEEPVFIVMEYKGSKGRPIVLVGKGVTFDSGGINLKPDGGHEMHMDMSGGAAVIHTLALVAKLGLKKHVIGLVPAVENMPGQHAYRIHDVLKSLSGKTIEIMHTDAEGRVILADGLTYAKRFKPSVVINVATLTGAALVALGTYASALFTKDDALAKAIETAAEESGDYAWRLPLWDEYEDAVKGAVGDVVNATGPSNKYGGAINGAMFLWQFAKELDCPWAHLDISPRMTAAPGDELAKGAAGTPVRLLTRFIEQWGSK